MSVIKALEHSAFRCQRQLDLKVHPMMLQYDLLIHTSSFQWVESSHLEPETQDSNPVAYHDAWRTVVGAKLVQAFNHVITC